MIEVYTEQKFIVETDKRLTEEQAVAVATSLAVKMHESRIPKLLSGEKSCLVFDDFVEMEMPDGKWRWECNGKLVLRMEKCEAEGASEPDYRDLWFSMKEHMLDHFRAERGLKGTAFGNSTSLEELEGTIDYMNNKDGGRTR